MIRLGRAPSLLKEGGGAGVVLHINNLENLTEPSADRAADILRSLRDPVLLLDGLHTILVGTSAAVLTVTTTHAQVRSVFSDPLTLGALPIDDVQALLEARYRHLALDGRTAIPPIAPDAVEKLYPLFRGDLRSLLAMLDEGTRLLVGVGTPGASIPLDAVRPALQQRYDSLRRERLDDRRQDQLDAWAASDPSAHQTQKGLGALWGVSQAAVSTALTDLERKGYVLALPRSGKEPIRYVLTGISRLIFG